MTKYIPLEKAKFILSHWEELTRNAKTQEEGMDILYNRINELPSIDPIAIIDEEIKSQELIKKVFDKSGVSSIAPRHIIMNLQELKSRLSLTQK